MYEVRFKTNNNKAGEKIMKKLNYTVREYQGFYDAPIEIVRNYNQLTDGQNEFIIKGLTKFMVDMIKDDLKIK